MTIQEYHFLQVQGDKKVKVFISWSGNKSKEIANLLREWIADVNYGIETWTSDKDIDTGAVWFKEICDNIRETANSIIVITRENKDKPWIMFEAGALSRGDDRNRVTLLLIDLEPSDLNQPLASFNAISPTKDDIWKLVLNLTERHNTIEREKEKQREKQSKESEINRHFLSEDRLKRIFDRLYPDFEAQLKEILNKYPKEEIVPKSPEQMRQDEIIQSLRSIERELLDTKDFVSPESIYNAVEVALERHDAQNPFSNHYYARMPYHK